MSLRLPVDYARCKDGEACPFADICKRRTTLAYDIGGEDRYAWVNFFATTARTMAGDVVCEHRIIAED